MNFSFLTLLSAITLFILILILCLYRFFKRNNLAEKLSKKRIKNFSVYKQLFSFILLLMGSFFLCLAAANFWYEGESVEVSSESKDIIIALDISKSMLSEDVYPNRLKFSKELIKKIVSHFKNDKFSLILFSGYSFIYCPLTMDKIAFNYLLDSVETEFISSGTTSFDSLFKLVSNSEKSSSMLKNLIIFTDGEDFSVDNSYFNIFKNLNIKVYTVGIGTKEGGPIQLYDDKGNKSGLLQDEKGSVVVSKLNIDFLKKISDESSGQFFVPESLDDINPLLKSIDQFEKLNSDSEQFLIKNYIYEYFAAPALILLGLQWLF